jgi:hypothetical protein
LLLLLVTLACPLWVSGQVKETKSFKKDIKVAKAVDSFEVSLAFPEVFNKRFKHRLSSGFTSRIFIEVLLQNTTQKQPLARTELKFTILYDIWDEQFIIRKEGLDKTVQFKLHTMKDLISKCASFKRLKLPPLVELPKSGQVQATVKIIVNPTSQKQRRKVREYLANPDGRGFVGSPRSFFGSFSKIFVGDKALQADGMYTYYSPKINLDSIPVTD